MNKCGWRCACGARYIGIVDDASLTLAAHRQAGCWAHPVSSEMADLVAENKLLRAIIQNTPCTHPEAVDTPHPHKRAKTAYKVGKPK